MKLLIVGLGSMGKRRARLIKGIDPAIQVFGVDSSAQRRTQAAELGITAYAGIAEALAAGQYDAGLVCTAPITHAGIIHELLQGGLPVFTELNLVSDGYAENMALAKQKGLPLCLSSTMLYRGDKRTGGVREIFGIDLPWLVDCFGEVTGVHAEKDKISQLEVDYPDSYFVTLRHADGTKGILAADVVSPKAVRNFECFGEGLHLFWEGNPKALYDFDHASGEKRSVNTYASFEHDSRYSDNIVENAYVDELTNFFAVLQGKQQPRWSFEKDRQVIDLIEKIEA